MTFGGEDLYPTVAEKAAVLGFALAKNHSFVDGNKRAAHAAMEVLLASDRRVLINELIVVKLSTHTDAGLVRSGRRIAIMTIDRFGRVSGGWRYKKSRSVDDPTPRPTDPFRRRRPG